MPVLTVLATVRPVSAQADNSTRSILNGVVTQLPIEKPADSTTVARPPALSVLLERLHLAGGFELGRALSNAASDSAGIVFDASSRPATTLTGNVQLEAGRFALSALGGASLTHNNGGGFARISGLFDFVRDAEDNPLWQIGADFTTVRSPGMAALTSSGMTVRAGNPNVLQAGLRAGNRTRASTRTAVTSLDLSRTMSRWSGRTLMSAQLSATGVFTRAPAARQVLTPLYIVNSGSIVLAELAGREPYFVAKRPQVVLSDLAVNLQASRGAWAIGGRGVARIGPSAAVWDDPVPNSTFMRQTRGGRVAAAARVLWAPFANWMITAEGGRQLSDPILGLSGVRYASVSVRMNFEAGQRPKAWSERSEIDRVVASTDRGNSDALVVSSTANSRGYRLLVLRDVSGGLIEIASEFTDWKPVALKPCSTRDIDAKSSEAQINGPILNRAGSPEVSDPTLWCGYFPLRPGVFHLVYRSDNGDWRVPPGLAAVDDTFGGKVGLLIIP